jgi:hypothetical protein
MAQLQLRYSLFHRHSTSVRGQLACDDQSDCLDHRFLSIGHRLVHHDHTRLTTPIYRSPYPCSAHRFRQRSTVRRLSTSFKFCAPPSSECRRQRAWPSSPSILVILYWDPRRYISLPLRPQSLLLDLTLATVGNIQPVDVHLRWSNAVDIG